MTFSSGLNLVFVQNLSYFLTLGGFFLARKEFGKPKTGFDILGLVGLGLSKLFPGKKKSSKREKVRKILDKY